MNLNPLKKDDNTDALVKALEDANNVGGGTPATDVTTPGVVDSAAIAADPQIANGGITPSAPADATSTDVVPGADTATVPAEDAAATDAAATSLKFDGNDLPMGLSSDADAHLSSEGSGENSELDGVKKSALEQLRPLIEKLDLEPADKFDKYLMMLRASDDPALIKPAFDAAQGIGGEKEKAQALLDIINEINYITANQQQSA